MSDYKPCDNINDNNAKILFRNYDLVTQHYIDCSLINYATLTAAFFPRKINLSLALMGD